MTYWPLPMERPRIKSTQRPRIGRPQWLDPYPGATWNMRRSGKTSVFFRFRWGDFLSPTAKLRVLKDDFWRRFGWSVLKNSCHWPRKTINSTVNQRSSPPSGRHIPSQTWPGYAWRYLSSCLGRLHTYLSSESISIPTYAYLYQSLPIYTYLSKFTHFHLILPTLSLPI